MLQKKFDLHLIMYLNVIWGIFCRVSFPNFIAETAEKWNMQILTLKKLFIVWLSFCRSNIFKIQPLHLLFLTLFNIVFLLVCSALNKWVFFHFFTTFRGVRRQIVIWCKQKNQHVFGHQVVCKWKKNLNFLNSLWHNSFR